MEAESTKRYSVKEVSALSGVTVRTLHLYDEMGLLKPASRTEAGYRMYGEKELLRLQQIIFYKEMQLPLNEIGNILNDSSFDPIQALMLHRKHLEQRRDNMNAMLLTIDKTIEHLTNKTMLKHEELYEGLPKERAEILRNEAIGRYGYDAVTRSENHLRKMSKEELEHLKKKQLSIAQTLRTLMQAGKSAESAEVQEASAEHYRIIRTFWGTFGSPDAQAEAYAGLGQLYVNDERFTMHEGKADPAFAHFLCKAMKHFANNLLK